MTDRYESIPNGDVRSADVVHSISYLQSHHLNSSAHTRTSAPLINPPSHLMEPGVRRPHRKQPADRS